MAYAGQVIKNPVTKQTIIFEATEKETGGQLFRFEGRFQPGGFAGVPHIHPFQDETFDVLQGEATIQIGKNKTLLKEGEKLMIPAGQSHTFWNSGEGELRVINEFMPGLTSTGTFYEFYFGLAQDGKAKKNGLPNIWQIALQAEDFSDHVRMANPPWFIQRLTFAIIRPIARMLGYKKLIYADKDQTQIAD